MSIGVHQWLKTPSQWNEIPHHCAKNDHLGFHIFYLWNGSKRKYIPDFLIRLRNGKHLILEVKGEDSQQNQAKRQALGEWVEAVNNKGGFGAWVAELSFSPSDIAGIFKRYAD